LFIAYTGLGPGVDCSTERTIVHPAKYSSYNVCWYFHLTRLRNTCGFLVLRHLICWRL